MQSTILSEKLSAFCTSHKYDVGEGIFLLTIPPDRKFGDICINVFPAVKVLKSSPQELGQKVLDFMKTQDFITDGNIQGGFVNLFVTDEFYTQELGNFSLPKFEKNKEVVVVDYMGANIGKPLHIGHLCTPLFGQATINLLRAMGFEVIADMHQGDWGGIFGKLITGWKFFGDDAAFAKDPINHLLEIYVAITQKCENDPTVEQSCRDAFKRLSEGEPKLVEFWKKFTDKSLAEVRDVMREFGVHPDIWVGESFYEGLPLPKLGNWHDLEPDNTMSAVVQELIEKGIATKNDDNSVGVEFPKEEKIPSCILQKRDGTHGYLASDLATIKYRLRNWSPSRILYFVDSRQSLHLQQVFSTAKKAWLSQEGREKNEEKRMKDSISQNEKNKNSSLSSSPFVLSSHDCELTHAANGFVALPDGAMSTRHGRVIFLKDLMQESFDRVKAILIERERTLKDADIKAVALGAIIYSFLCQDRERDWIFEWDKVLAFEGNSGPYLQYTYVRWKKILTELGSQNTKHKTQNTNNEQGLTPFDKDLILDILAFNDILIACGTTYKFHLLVAHLATMARHLNALYVNTPKIVETPEAERATRVEIVQKCLEMIEYATKILGMPLPEEM